MPNRRAVTKRNACEKCGRMTTARGLVCRRCRTDAFLPYDELKKRVQEMEVILRKDGKVDIKATVRLYREKYPDTLP